MPLLRRHERRPRPLRLALDFALFAGVLAAWPVLRLWLLATGRGRTR